MKLIAGLAIASGAWLIVTTPWGPCGPVSFASYFGGLLVLAGIVLFMRISRNRDAAANKQNA